MRIVSPRKSWSFSMVSGWRATTELSSLIASSTTRRFGAFFRSKMAVLKSLFVPLLKKHKTNDKFQEDCKKIIIRREKVGFQREMNRRRKCGSGNGKRKKEMGLRVRGFRLISHNQQKLTGEAKRIKRRNFPSNLRYWEFG